jgi:outer membrane protein TolC
MKSLFAVLISATAVFASDATPQKRTMTMEECVRLALEHNFDIRIQRYSPEIARYNLDVFYGGYDPTLSLSAEHAYDLSPGGIDDQNRPFLGSETEANSIGSSLRGLLPWGLTYNLSGNMSDRYGTGVGGFPFEITGGNVGAFELRQPLMKNFWIDNTRLNITMAKSELKISEQALRQQLMLTVTSVEAAYYNLIFAQENVKVQTAALGLADRLLAENKKRVEVGALAPLDEKQAQAQVASSRSDLLTAERTQESQQNILKNLLTSDYQNWHPVEIQPAEKLAALPASVQLQDSWYKGLTMRPDLLQGRLNLEKQHIVLKYQKNQLFPQLDLVGSYGYSAARKEFSDAFDQIGRGDAPFWSYGAQLTFPLGNRAARNSYKAAKATQEQVLLQLKKLEQNVMVEIDDAVGQVKTSFERVDSTKQARVFAEEALDAEEKKLANGKSTSFEVLRLQRDLTIARSSEIRALADYNIALSNLAFREGATFERNHIDLKLK